MLEFVIGLQVSEAQVTAALVALDGTASGAVTLPLTSVEATVPAAAVAVEASRQALAAAPAEAQVAAIGVGLSGNLPGAEITAALDQALHLPVIANTGLSARALWEARFGAGRGLDPILYVGVGQSLQGAILQRGRPWHGASMQAGDIGHLLIDMEGRRKCRCGQRGHLEAYAAGPALAAHYREVSGREEPFTPQELSQRARAGDTLAWQVLATGGRILGSALGGLVCALDPGAVILGGGVAAGLGDEWWQPLTQALRAAPLPSPATTVIARAQFNPAADAAVAAACLALAARD